MKMPTFAEALKRWVKAERDRVEALYHYETTYAAALIAADGKSAEIRKAQADLASADAAKAHALAACEAKMLEHMLAHFHVRTVVQEGEAA